MCVMGASVHDCPDPDPCPYSTSRDLVAQLRPDLVCWNSVLGVSQLQDSARLDFDVCMPGLLSSCAVVP